MRSQSGPGAGSFLSVPPANPLVRFDSQIFRVLLLHRFRLPFPLSRRFCRCGVSLTNLAIIVQLALKQGFLGVFALESVARVCREGGARVTTNMFVRDLDLDVPNAARDGRRLEVVADVLPLFGGVQLAIDTTLVSPLHSNGTAWRDAGDRWSLLSCAASRAFASSLLELRSACGADGDLPETPMTNSQSSPP